MIKLIATDMDGTWLNDNKTYDQALFDQILEQVEKQDIKFVIASGNQYENLKTRFPKVVDKLYFIAENGALVAKGNQILHVNHISDEEFKTMIQITEEIKNPVVVAGLRSAYVRTKDGTAYHKEMEKYFKHITVVNSFDEIKDDIFKISFDTNVNELAGLIQKIRQNYPQFEVVAGGQDSVDVQAKGMSKAVGLRYLSQSLNINPEEMVAFGDGENDNAMLEYVGLSYATSAALEGTRKIVDQVIGSSNDSAVQKEIIKLLNANQKD